MRFEKIDIVASIFSFVYAIYFSILNLGFVLLIDSLA